MLAKDGRCLPKIADDCRSRAKRTEACRCLPMFVECDRTCVMQTTNFLLLSQVPLP